VTHEAQHLDASSLQTIRTPEECIESLRRLGISEEDIKKLIETVDAIIDNRLDALLFN
jgi:ribosomal protein S4